jgi:hypothetical protein
LCRCEHAIALKLANANIAITRIAVPMHAGEAINPGHPPSPGTALLNVAGLAVGDQQTKIHPATASNGPLPGIHGNRATVTKTKGIPMKRKILITACAFALPGATLAATRNYATAAFEKVSVAEGIAADITVSQTRSVMAETRSDSFDDLRITVKDNVLQIDRPPRSWFTFGQRPSYQVHVNTPALHSLTASSGAEVKVNGALEGDFSVAASSGSDVHVSQVKGGSVALSTSSGSDISIAGTCVSLKAEASSGSDLNADDLKCENVSLQASSGSDISVAASKNVTGHASSGSDVRVRGKSTAVQVDKSSGAHVMVKE